MGRYEPQDASPLSRQDKRDALESLLFVTEKRMGALKVENELGNKQRAYEGYEKSTGSSPMVTSRRLVLTAAIDAHEGQDVATVDIKTTFLHAENNPNNYNETAW